MKTKPHCCWWPSNKSCVYPAHDSPVFMGPAGIMQRLKIIPRLATIPGALTPPSVVSADFPPFYSQSNSKSDPCKSGGGFRLQKPTQPPQFAWQTPLQQLTFFIYEDLYPLWSQVYQLATDQTQWKMTKTISKNCNSNFQTLSFCQFCVRLLTITPTHCTQKSNTFDSIQQNIAVEMMQWHSVSCCLTVP